ncbi:hypothetical protein WICPIJ_002756 [Wickerhamomyces pijperi]|uniref:Uncharacterized protein n=1 Tax=Wickerhamomyces pijperi TaxID=599730 RepID=A0A9P8QB74_WICPI|nr:hypothetical protein WICPIJ_002756 [Wickerhamomyces pijperi]
MDLLMLERDHEIFSMNWFFKNFKSMMLSSWSSLLSYLELILSKRLEAVSASKDPSKRMSSCELSLRSSWCEQRLGGQIVVVQVDPNKVGKPRQVFLQVGQDPREDRRKVAQVQELQVWQLGQGLHKQGSVLHVCQVGGIDRDDLQIAEVQHSSGQRLDVVAQIVVPQIQTFHGLIGFLHEITEDERLFQAEITLGQPQLPGLQVHSVFQNLLEHRQIAAKLDTVQHQLIDTAPQLDGLDKEIPIHL